jgi:CHAT domain-containing protein
MAQADIDEVLVYLIGPRAALAWHLDVERGLETRELAAGATQLESWVDRALRAMEEATEVARLTAPARIVAATSLDEVQDALEGAARVHWLAHGVANETHPGLGHLGSGGLSEGGFRLDARQASLLPLKGAQVVLSSCESNAGRWRDGAGLDGLTCGFLGAGAAQVVASYWPVDGGVAATLMGLFYNGLNEGLDAAEALRKARLTLRRMDDPRGFAMAHPVFWGPWTVVR